MNSDVKGEDERKTNHPRSKIRSLFIAAKGISRFKRLRYEAKEREKETRNSFDFDASSRRYLSFHFRERQSSSNINVDAILSVRTPSASPTASPTSEPGSWNTSPIFRSFVQEGPVQLSSGVSSQLRYMFLFNDVLLIAKFKSSSSFKLKNRLRVSELWLADCIDEVSEVTVDQEKSFVVGWPTTNFVATFSSVEEKDLWKNALRKCIDDQVEQQDTKTITLKVINRDIDQSFIYSKSFSVSITDDAKAVIKMSLNHFQSEDPADYHLWVFSGKENYAYPLIGHEKPFAIQMNHLRDNLLENQSDSDPQGYDSETTRKLYSANTENKCQFILKKKKKQSTITSELTGQKKRRNPARKSPMMHWTVSRKLSKEKLLGSDSAAPGLLFGLPLSQVAAEDGQLPKPVQDILVNLFRRGPATIGIFRRSGLMRHVKQIRQSLDEGKEVSFEDKSAVLLTTLLKNYLRSLPDCLFGCEYYNELTQTNTVEDLNQRIEELKMVLNKLPKINQEFIKRLFCVFYHIVRFSSRNNMTSQNVAVCVAPSILYQQSRKNTASTPDENSLATVLVQFLIEHYEDVFGEEAVTSLGEESDIEQDVSDDQAEELGRISSISDDELGKNERKFSSSEGFLGLGQASILGLGGSDSNLDRTDTDEDSRLRVRRNTTDNNLWDTKSTPSTPLSSRKEWSLLEHRKHKEDFPKSMENLLYNFVCYTRQLSDLETVNNSETFEIKNEPNRKVKKKLSSTSNSFELIEHKTTPETTNYTRNQQSSPQIMKVTFPNKQESSKSWSPQLRMRSTDMKENGYVASPNRSPIATHLNGRTRKNWFRLAGSKSVDEARIDKDLKKVTPKLKHKRSFDSSSSNQNGTSEVTHRKLVASKSDDSICLSRENSIEENSRPNVRLSPEIIFQSIDRKRQPAVPTYDEHMFLRSQAIQRKTQYAHLHEASSTPKQRDRPERPTNFSAPLSGCSHTGKSTNEVPLSLSLDSSRLQRLRMLTSPQSEFQAAAKGRQLGSSSPVLQSHSVSQEYRPCAAASQTNDIKLASLYKRTQTPDSGITSENSMTNSVSDDTQSLEGNIDKMTETMSPGTPIKTSNSYLPLGDLFPPEARNASVNLSSIIQRDMWFAGELPKYSVQKLSRDRSGVLTDSSTKVYTEREHQRILHNFFIIKHDDTSNSASTCSSLSEDFADIKSPSHEDIKNIITQEESYV